MKTKVICPICNKKFKSLMSHIVLGHKVPMSKFRKKYPKILLVSETTIKKIRKICKRSCVCAWWIKLNVENPAKNIKTKQKISKVLKQMYVNNEIKSWNKGLTKETDYRVKQLSKFLKGKSKSKEHRLKISLSKTGKPLNKKQLRSILKAGKIGREKINKERTGKTWEEYYGIGKARKLKKFWGKLNKTKGMHFWKNKPHPRGMKGKKHSEKTRQLLREITINYLSKQKKDGLPFFPMVGRNETEILDQLEFELNTKIERQYKVCGYFLDGYSKKFNIAFMVNEPRHYSKKQIIKDAHRTKNIKNYLNCEIIIIKDV